MNLKGIFACAICALFTLLSMGSLYAQPPGGGGMGGQGRGGQGRGGMQQGGPQNMKINFVESAGIITFDYNEIVDEIKIDDDKDVDKRATVQAALNKYQQGMENLGMKYSAEIEYLKELQPSQEMDRDARQSFMSELQEKMTPIKTDAIPLHEELNATIEETLSSSEKRRWKSYYEEKCTEVRFSTSTEQRERPERGQRPE